MYQGQLIPPDSNEFTSAENLFNYQAKVIKQLAEEESCVIIGRCADYALKDRDDVINLFITAPLENRIERVARRNGITRDEAKERIKRTDKSRASYYNYYCSKAWGDAKSYDLCIDSSLLGIEGTVELLEKLVTLKGIEQ